MQHKSYYTGVPVAW